MFRIVEEATRKVEVITHQVKIKVVGVGGGGGNAINHMIEAKINGVEFIAANTDVQALEKSNAPTTLQLGERATGGFGAGADPALGREAAIETRASIEAALAGADMVFIAAGMGGGTGTGAAPVIAEIARSMNSLTVAVVTKPFAFELDKRAQVAIEGIRELNKHVNALITIPNEKLFKALGGDQPLTDAFKAADDILSGAVQGIAELITYCGLINLDFADLRTIMKNTGMAIISSGRGEGENRAHDAAQHAINNPLLEDVDLSNAGGLLVNIMASSSLTGDETTTINQCMSALAAPGATVVIGKAINEDMKDSIKVTLIATGLGDPNLDSGTSVAANGGGTQSLLVAEPDKEQVVPQLDGHGKYDIPAIERRKGRNGKGERRRQDNNTEHEPPLFNISEASRRIFNASWHSRDRKE